MILPYWFLNANELLILTKGLQGMAQIFGDYIDEQPENLEYLVIGFSTSSIPLKQRWRNNGLSADFIADYLQTFFVGKQNNGIAGDAPIPVHSKNAVKYIANELLENAMKFNDETAQYCTRIAFHLCSERLIFYVTNSVNSEGTQKFQEFLNELMSDDPNELYIRQMEANAEESSNKGHSGLGFLSMICDYSAKLGWKFETLERNPPVNVVTTMVCLNV